MRRFVFLFALVSLLGTTALVEANIDKKLHAPKFPKLVDQRPEAPKLVARDDYYSPRYLQVKVVAGNEISLENDSTQRRRPFGVRWSDLLGFFFLIF